MLEKLKIPPPLFFHCTYYVPVTFISALYTLNPHSNLLRQHYYLCFINKDNKIENLNNLPIIKSKQGGVSGFNSAQFQRSHCTLLLPSIKSLSLNSRFLTLYRESQEALSSFTNDPMFYLLRKATLTPVCLFLALAIFF